MQRSAGTLPPAAAIAALRKLSGRSAARSAAARVARRPGAPPPRAAGRLPVPRVGARASERARRSHAADALLQPWFACLRAAVGEIGIVDCHAHLGCAHADSSRVAVEELLDALNAADARAVVFPLADVGSHREANDCVLEAARASDGRLVAFCRVEANGDGLLSEAERAVALGAAGVELHLRPERFRVSDPDVRRVAAFVHERRLPMIVHAGRGVPSPGREALELAAAHPRAPIVLAHAAVADLAWIWRELPDVPNLLFDTSWWNIADQLALFSLVPPGQILFGSNVPYGRAVAGASVTLRAALAAGLDREQIAAVMGGQLERLLAGRAPLRLGGPPPRSAAGPGPLLERLYMLLVAAAARLVGGYPADEYLRLARLACSVPAEHPDAPVAASVLELLDRHAHYVASHPPQAGPRIPGVHLVFLAAAVARTPGQPLPAFARRSGSEAPPPAAAPAPRALAAGRAA